MLDAPQQGLDRAESLGRAWVVRRFLETGDAFAAPEGVGHWLGMDSAGFRGICLPASVLEKVYHVNVERAFGVVPAALDRALAQAELERIVNEVERREANRH